jgi:hypothetical protein
MLIRDLPSANAIKIGSFFVKPSAVAETLTRSCRIVFHEANDSPSLPLGTAGSATLIRYCNINYVVTTRHQLGIARGGQLPIDIVETVRIASGTETLANIPLRHCIFETSNPEEEYHDILIFQAAETWDNFNRDQPDFYHLAPFFRGAREGSLLVGYPTLDGVMDEYMNGFPDDPSATIHIKRAISDCSLDSSFRTNVEHYRRYLHAKTRPIVDGYSGGAVFSIVGDVGDYRAVLDGIVVRAGARHVHIVDADYLVKAISQGRRS